MKIPCADCNGAGKSTNKKEVENLYKYYGKKYTIIPEWQKQLIEQCPYCHGGGINEAYIERIDDSGYWDSR